MTTRLSRGTRQRSSLTANPPVRPPQWQRQLMADAVKLADLLTSASRTGAVCLLDIDSPAAVTLDADRVVQAGSTFKIAVALEVYCQANAGELDLHEQLRFAVERALVRDSTIEQVVDLMLRLSDNAATNVLLHRVTRERIMARLTSLDLAHTTVSHDVLDEVTAITARLDKLAQAVGFANWEPTSELVQAGGYDQVADRLARICVDEHALPHDQMGPTTTARELATLYRLIWQDQAGPADACAPPSALLLATSNCSASRSASTPQAASTSPAKAAESWVSSSTTPASSPTPTVAATPLRCSPAPGTPSTANSPATPSPAPSPPPRSTSSNRARSGPTPSRHGPDRPLPKGLRATKRDTRW
jgi:beta-lactamase class A